MAWKNLLGKRGCFPLWTAEFNYLYLTYHFLSHKRVSLCLPKDLVVVSRLGVDRGSKMLCSQTSENFFFSPFDVFPFQGGKRLFILLKGGRYLCSTFTAMWSCGQATRGLCKDVPLPSASSASFLDLVRASRQSSTPAVVWFFGFFSAAEAEVLVFHLFAAWQREQVYWSVVV